MASKSSGKIDSSGLMSKEQLSECRKSFNIYDPDDSGFIEAHNLKNVLRALGFEPKSEEIKQMLKSLKCDAKSKINFDQFTEIVRKKTVEKDAKLEITKAFKLFDHENSGKITVDDLRRVADELGEKISDQELQEMITEADLDHDGQVNEDEFYRIMKKTSLY